MQCQRCRVPLVLHESLVDYSSAQLGLLINDSNGLPPSSSSDTVRTVINDSWNNRRMLFANRVHANMAVNNSMLTAASSDSFILLSESLVKRGATKDSTTTNEVTADGTEFSKSIKTAENLFQALSATSEIDYPICSECADLIKEELGPKYDEFCKERDTYIGFLNMLKDQPGMGSDQMEELQQEIKELESQNEKSLTELKKAENERLAAEKELALLLEESRTLAEEEDSFYREQNECSIKIEKALKEKSRVDSLFDYHTLQLQKLQKINVYNDVFCIGHDGYFGTINGLRLGRLKDRKVEWSEINAAWGQTLLLVATVVNKLNIKLNGYRLRPLGSTSRIEKLQVDPKTGQPVKPLVLELYSSGDSSFERILNHKRLDSAMVAFLHVLKQVGQFVESRDSSLKLPYVIDNDKIGGYSIRLSISSSNESWTVACKYVLTNSKWILAYAANAG